jgi:hypothetical protein
MLAAPVTFAPEFEVTVPLPIACLVAALGIGLLVEAIAGAFKVWTYRSPLFLLVNIVVVFGLVQGYGVGWIIGGHGALRGVFPVLFMVGAVLGILIEGLNQYWLHAWSWSDRPLFGISRAIDKSAFVGVAWGFTPLFTVLLARLIVKASMGV